jgi:hypothetical protein
MLDRKGRGAGTDQRRRIVPHASAGTPATRAGFPPSQECSALVDAYLRQANRANRLAQVYGDFHGDQI